MHVKINGMKKNEGESFIGGKKINRATYEQQQVSSANTPPTFGEFPLCRISFCLRFARYLERYNNL
jgi:hypothetical protein